MLYRSLRGAGPETVMGITKETDPARSEGRTRQPIGGNFNAIS